MAFVRKPKSPLEEQQRAAGGVIGMQKGYEQPGLGQPATPKPLSGPGVGVPQQAGPQGPTGARFAQLADYARANQGEGARMANNMTASTNAFGKIAVGAPGIQNQKTAQPGGSMSAPAGIQSAFSRLQNDEGLAQRVEDNSKLAGSFSGRREMAAGLGQGQYSSGEKDLDSALIGIESGGKLNDLSKRYSGLTNMVRQRNENNALAPSLTTAGQNPNTMETAVAAGLPTMEQAAAYQEQPGGYKDLTDGSAVAQGKDPNTLSDEELSAMGYYDTQAPGETYAHYSDRMQARGAKNNSKSKGRGE